VTRPTYDQQIIAADQCPADIAIARRDRRRTLDEALAIEAIEMEIRRDRELCMRGFRR
jgi:hypothetical protein